MLMKLFHSCVYHLLLCFVVSLPVNAQNESTPNSLEVTSKLNYLMYVPSNYEKDAETKWPLMLFLHGSGERGNDLELVKKWGPPKIAGEKDFPFVLVAPQCPSGARWNIDHLKQLLDHIIKTQNIDKERVYLTGLSMGGYGSWALASKHPEVFAAVVPVCGGGDPKSVGNLVDVPIWVFHGDADKVVPSSQSTQMVEAIQAKGGSKIKLTLYEGVGHNSWSETYSNPALYDWLLAQSRKLKK